MIDLMITHIASALVQIMEVSSHHLHYGLLAKFNTLFTYSITLVNG